MKKLLVIGVVLGVVLLAGLLIVGSERISARDYTNDDYNDNGYYGCDSGCPNYQATGHGCTAQNNCGISTCGAVRAAYGR